MEDQTYVEVGDLQVDDVLFKFVVDEALPGSGVEAASFWRGLSEIVHELGPRHGELLAVRARMQAAIDHWHRSHSEEPHDAHRYREFLTSIGYVVPAGGRSALIPMAWTARSQPSRDRS